MLNLMTEETMKKIYILPSQKVINIDLYDALLAGSLDGNSPTDGLPDNAPTNGGSGDEDEFAGAKAQGRFDWSNNW